MPSVTGKGLMLHGVDNNTDLINDTVQRLNRTFQSGKTRPHEFRRTQLQNLLKFLDENVDLLCDALWKDLHKPRQECILTEIEITKNEIHHALANLKKWMAPKATEKSLATMMDYPFIQHEPYGTVMIIGAWNYPVNLLLSPLVGAIAAGNCALIKPSEVSENVERSLYEMLPKYIDQECYTVACAGPEGTSAILKYKFDYIFYTGSTTVGKIVYEAAAKHLTPVTLELGGKSPVWVDATSDMTLAARRIMWGKLLNAGQTCIAPDYVMCTSETQTELVKAMKTVVKEFLGDNPQKSNDFCHIISSRQFDRLRKLLTNQNVAFGGDFDADTRYLAPTVLSNVGLYSEVMKSEIFGPILPIVPVENAETAIRYVNEGEKPLALYVFSKDDKVSEKFLKETTSGGACINDCIMHIAAESLPFGGVGSSGLGAYHGFYSFETFSHKRAVLWKKHGLDFLVAMRYPPYSDFKTNGLTFLMKYRRPLPAWLNKLVIFGLGLATGFATRYLATQPPVLLQAHQRSEEMIPQGALI